MIAGFGYAVVLRAKLITVTVDKRQYALGPEILYTGLMNYVSFHLENRMRSKRDAIRDRLLQKFGSREIFKTALNIKISEVADPSERKDLEMTRDEVLNSRLMTEVEKTYGVVRLLIELQPDEADLVSFLQNLSTGTKTFTPSPS